MAISAPTAARAYSYAEPKSSTGVVSSLGLLALVFISVVSSIAMRAQMPDDAYIYLRMAENVVHRGEWAFNPGVPVNAATSPLYEVLVSLLTALHLPGMTTPLVLASAIGLAVLAFAIYRGTAYLGLRAAFLLALVSITFPTLLRSEGLETPMYLACVAITALFVERNNEYATGLAAGLTAIGRPEGGALIVIALAALWLRSGRFPWRGVILSLIPIALWLLFCEHTFHTVVPHTMKIKAMQSAVRFWQGSWLLEFIKQLKALLILLPFTVAGGWMACKRFREHPFLGVVLAFGIVQIVGYTLLHAPAMYYWYDAPGHLAYLLAAFSGILAVLPWILRRVSPRPVHAAGTVVVFLTVAYLAVNIYWQRTHSAPYRASPDYILAAHWLHDHAAPGDWVAADEIGYLGAYSGMPVRDMLGLADPRSVAAIQQHRWDFWFTDSPEPRYIVVHVPAWVGEPGFSDTPWSAPALNQYAGEYHPAFHSGIVEIMAHNPQ